MIIFDDTPESTERGNSSIDASAVRDIAFGVAKDIEGMEIVDNYILLDVETDNSFVSREGTFVKESAAHSTAIPVEEGEVYRIVGSYMYQTRLYALMNDTHKVSVYPNVSSSINTKTLDDVTITIPSGVTELRASSYLGPLEVYKVDVGAKLKVSTQTRDYLHGKKWAVCGDSFTAGDFTGYTDADGHTGTNSDAYDKTQGVYKTYPWWIGTRNDMKIQWLARNGAKFTNIGDSNNIFSNTASATNYTKIASDCDYITLQYGLNESGLTDAQIGTKTDNDNTTLWGAYNVVLTAILTANPFVKIGIIISDAWLPQKYHDALIDIAKYWGIPYLDLKDGEQVPMMNGGKLSEHSSVAQSLRDNAFKISSGNFHPVPKAHEYRSTVIENFLRSL